MPVRKIKPGYLNTTAAIKSQKLGRRADAESSLERDFLFYLDKVPEVQWFEEQPLEIKYRDDKGKVRSYFPDVLVQRQFSGQEPTYTLYEVKYRQNLWENWVNLKPKFKAAIQVCRDKGWRFKIVTEKEIRTPYFENLEFLHHFSRTTSPMEGEIRHDIYQALKKLKYATIEEVIAFVFRDKENQLAAYPVLWRMIGDKTILVDLSIPLRNQSEISIREEDNSC